MNKALAQVLNIDGIQIEGPKQDAGGMISLSDNVGTIIGSALSYVFAFAGIALLLMIISSGFTLMLSAGDTKKLAKGRASLTNAILGFVIVFAAFWIVQAVGIVLGWDVYIAGVFGQ